jgi:hypothetical protein
MLHETSQIVVAGRTDLSLVLVLLHSAKKLLISAEHNASYEEWNIVDLDSLGRKLRRTRYHGH